MQRRHYWNCSKDLPRTGMRWICTCFLGQGELISQVPGYVNILNRDYTAESVHFSRGKERIEQKGSQTIIYT